MIRVTKPSTSRLATLVTEELGVIPRGDFHQNMYEQVRLNGLGRRAQIAGSVSAAHEFALRAVRVQQPDFVPELLGS
jgi:hypothetical protein